jgi:SnoaL-like domain
MTEIEIRASIEDSLRSYCRGIDRLDGALIEAAFHPGASLIDYGPEPITIESFVPRALDSLGRKYTATQHRLSNITMRFDGDTAFVESYVLATHVEVGDGGRRLHTFAGRYIDRFENHDGHWRIMQRTLRNDWSSVEPMGEPMSGTYVPSGRAGTPDPF